MRESASDPRIGLCVGGGGITGAMYEVGVLAAIEDAFDEFTAADFDAYVGTSAGATVAVALAGGWTAQRMYRALLDPSDDFFPLQRHHLLRLDTREWKRVWLSALGAARRLLSSATAKPLALDVWNELDRFYDSLPAGLFTMDAYERFLIGFMTRRGIPHQFTAMRHPLLIVASDLDLGERAVFGRNELRDIPVARAVAAASASPLLFAPVRIRKHDYVDGGIGDAAHADLAAEMGCDLVLVINPAVPVRADLAARTVPTGHGPMKRVRDKGMLWVNSQSWRMRSQTRLHMGLERFRAIYPNTEIVLIEPANDDATMFMYSATNFAARRAILEDGYSSTVRRLRDPSFPLRRALEARGLAPKVPRSVRPPPMA